MSNTCGCEEISAFEFDVIKRTFERIAAAVPFDERSARQQIVNLTLDFTGGKQPSDQFVSAVLAVHVFQQRRTHIGPLAPSLPTGAE